MLNPYDPPGAPVETRGTLEEGLAQGHSRARWLVGLLAFGIVVNACLMLSGFLQHALLTRAASGTPISHAEASANDVRHASIGYVGLATFLVTAVVWLLWMYRAYSNLQWMGSGRTDHRPGWAVGYWFVPVLTLFRPFQITKELWLRSRSRNVTAVVQDTGTPALLGLWWLAWLVFNIASPFLVRGALGAKTLPELQSLTTKGIVRTCLSILSAALALAVVRSIDRLQVAEPEAMETPA